MKKGYPVTKVKPSLHDPAHLSEWICNELPHPATQTSQPVHQVSNWIFIQLERKEKKKDGGFTWIYLLLL